MLVEGRHIPACNSNNITSQTSLSVVSWSFSPALYSNNTCRRTFACHLILQEHLTLMAANSAISEEDLVCPQCSEIYCFPVLLKCGHNICRVCLHKFWEWKGCRECPVCGCVSVPGRPPINLALKIAADEHQLQRTSRSEDVCLLHNEKLKIFCNNDEEPICVVCQVSKQHKVHECCPVQEAATQKRVTIIISTISLLSLICQRNIVHNNNTEMWLCLWNDFNSQVVLGWNFNLVGVPAEETQNTEKYKE